VGADLKPAPTYPYAAAPEDAADRALRIRAQPQDAELHVHGIDDQQSRIKRLA
jgi:hypothetical protein